MADIDEGLIEGDIEDDGDGELEETPPEHPPAAPPVEKPPDLPGGGVSFDPGRSELGERSEYEIERVGVQGPIKSIDYKNGESVEFLYDDQGNLTGVVDTASDTRMINTSAGWVLEDANGNKVPIKGDVTVDQTTGAITAKLENGTSITTHPNGRTVATDKDGNLVAVNNPAYRVGTNNTYVVSPAGGTAAYQDGQMVAATDVNGNQYIKNGDQWLKFNKDGSLSTVDGDVTIDEYSGVQVVPRARDQAAA